MRKIEELKLKLNSIAEDIRKSNAELKTIQKTGIYCGDKMRTLNGIRYTYRHHHIAYCELRGKTREQIEKPRQYNNPNETEIKRIKTAYAWEIIETKENV